MSDPACPVCNSEMSLHGDAFSGQMHYCGFCRGILASDRWLTTNMRQTVLRSLRTFVFDGTPAGYRCPKCQGEMVKGPVPTAQGTTIEIDGCLRCGSLWFDNGEIRPFVPNIQDIAPDTQREDNFAKTISSVWGAISSITSRLTDHSDQEE